MFNPKISSMGSKMRVVYLPTTKFRRGERVRLRIVGERRYIVKNVAKMGKYLVVVIPTAVWDLFPPRARVSIRKESRGDLDGK